MADRYVIPAGGASNVVGTWSATSGGAGGASIPVSGDSVFCDSASGPLVWTGSQSFDNLDCTGYTSTMSGSGTLTILGDTFKLVAGMTYTADGTITFTGANAVGDITLTRAGKTSNQSYTFNGAGKVFKLADAHNLGTGSVQVTAGELDSEGFAITCNGLSFSTVNAVALTLTGSVLTLAGAVGWSNVSTLTWAAPAEISIPLNTNPGNAMFTFGFDVPLLTIRLNTTGAGVGGRISGISTGGTGLVINELRFTGAPSAGLISTVLSIVSDMRIDECAFPEGVELVSSVNGTQRTITTNTNEISFDGCMIRDIVISGGPAIATNSIDLGNNSGITFQNFGANTHEITGITYAGDPPVAGEADVYAFKVVGGEPVYVGTTTSDPVTGEYTVGTPDNDSGAYIIVSGDSNEAWDAMGGITPQAP